LEVLLIVANGQLGNDLLRVFQAAGDDVLPFTHTQLDVCSEERVSAVIAQAKPDVVLNTAAFHKVEECEEKPTLAFEVNGTAAMNLALACQRSGAMLVHFRTD
jgi:dTDP-4-dehydrorhamnose reductase